MSNKNKQNNFIEQVQMTASQCGLAIMALAATAGIIELPDHLGSRIVTPIQPAFAFAASNQDQISNVRRDKEDTAPHYISYSEVQRTPSRSRSF